jgi:hypothetical protein
MNYHIINAECINDLEKVVNEYLLKGYNPVGGVSVVTYEDRSDGLQFEYIQAMFKKVRKGINASRPRC